MTTTATTAHRYKHFGFSIGLGGLSAGLSRGHARVGTATATLECIGGVDVDPVALRDFYRLNGVHGTLLDLFDREDYAAFHGHEPPDDWREATPADILAAAGGRFPDIVHTSSPCKGFSGLLSTKASKSRKYGALNGIVLRSTLLAMEAFADDPPSIFLLENVPRIQDRGRQLLDQIQGLLLHYGYATAETTHDCGELGGLAQHRKRFLLVARHRQKVRPFLYEPPKQRVRGVGEVLEHLPMPGDPRGGSMHRLPRLEWQTWVRLALIDAGKDWRSLNRLPVVDGYLRDIGIVPIERRNFGGGPLGVVGWDESVGAVAGESMPTNGRYSVADPRSPRDLGDYQPYGVVPWKNSIGAVTAQAAPGTGVYTVADPRVGDGWNHGVLGVGAWDEPVGVVTGGAAPSSGRFSVADPRATGSWGKGKYRVSGMDEPCGAVIGASGTGQGAHAVADPRFSTVHHNNVFRLVRWTDGSPAVTAGVGPSSGGMSVADPRPSWSKTEDGPWAGGGHYGVVPWTLPAGAVVGNARHDNGRWSVADRRMPEAREQLDPAPVIVALDGTWHRPFTTLELAALQGLVDFATEGALELNAQGGASGQRERIGNAVPRYTAEAIGNVMAHTLLLETLGTTFALSSTPIWVREVVVGLSVDGSA